MKSRKLASFIALSTIAAATLSACGGGGGSSGDTAERYSINVSASPTVLPSNLYGMPYRGVGNNPFLSVVRVDVREGNRMAETTSVGCNVNGVNYGGLLQLDDDGEDSEDDSSSGAQLYQTITGDTNSGAISFGFLSLATAGTARVTCSVTDPRDNKVWSDYVDIQVGATTGLPALINAIDSVTRNGLEYVAGDPMEVAGTSTYQIAVTDGAQQRVPNPAAANVRVEIIGDTTGGARLGDTAATAVQLSTVNGIGTFPLTAGNNAGAITLLITTDRADNNVANGATDPVQATLVIPVGDAGGSGSTGGGGGTPAGGGGLTVTPPATRSFTTSAGGVTSLNASGGTAPYTFTLVDASTREITVGADGIINVAPGTTPGSYNFGVRVTDSAGATAVSNFTLTVTQAEPQQPLKVETPGDERFDYTRGGTVRIHASGGVPDYTYAIDYTNLLPDQSAYAQQILSIDGTGLISVNRATEPVERTDNTQNPPRRYQEWVDGAYACRGEVGKITAQSDTYRISVVVTDANGTRARTDRFNIIVACNR